MGFADTDVLDVVSDQCASRSNRVVAERGGEAPTVRTIRTLLELEELRDVWNLWCQDPGSDMDFYLTSARSRPDFARPHVMVVYREGRPDCMLVGQLEHCRLPLKVGYATLFEPESARLVFVQGGLLGNVSKENCHLLIRELKQCLQSGEADSAELARLTMDALLYEAAQSEFNYVCRGHLLPFHEHLWLDLPGSFQEFVQGLSRKTRHEFRRHAKKLADDFSGRIHIRCYRHEEEVGELVQEVEKISAKTYQRALGVGFRPDTETLEALRIAARKAGLRGCVLSLDGQPCAFFLGTQYKTTFHGNFMGFDPQFARYSPGLLVLMHSIEECFDPNLRITRFDLGRGDRQYKRVICNHSRQDGPLYLYARSWAGLRLNFLTCATAFLDLAARKLLAKSSFLQERKRARQGRFQRAKSKAHLLEQG